MLLASFSLMPSSWHKLSPPAPLWTHTAPWRADVRVGYEVEIRESTSLVRRPKWHRATVLALGHEEDVPRKLEGGAELEALEEDGTGGKVPLLLLGRKRQVRDGCAPKLQNSRTYCSDAARRKGCRFKPFFWQPNYEYCQEKEITTKGCHRRLVGRELPWWIITQPS